MESHEEISHKDDKHEIFYFGARLNQDEIYIIEELLNSDTSIRHSDDFNQFLITGMMKTAICNETNDFGSALIASEDNIDNTSVIIVEDADITPELKQKDVPYILDRVIGIDTFAFIPDKRKTYNKKRHAKKSWSRNNKKR